jgi:hypothetical protein
MALVLISRKSKFHFISKFRLLYLILSISLIFVEYGTWRGTAPASTLLCSLAIIKLFEMNEKRDTFSFLFIFQFFVLSLAVQVEDFYYIFLIFICVLLSFSILLFMDLGRTHFNSLKKILNIFFLSLPLLALLIVLFPRFQFGGFFFSKSVAKTGFGKSLRPGEISKLINDPTSVFHAELDFKINRSELYWRGDVLALNKGFSFEKGKIQDSVLYKTKESEKSYSVYFHEIWSGPIFTLNDTSRIKLNSKAVLRKRRGGVFEALSLMDQKVRFKGFISKNNGIRKHEGFNENYLQLDLDIPQELSELVSKNESLKSRPSEVVEFLKNLFFKDFSYTLSPGTYDPLTGLNEFLFVRKKGFCGHFATSSAILFRLFNIPSRVVLGYQGGEFNEVGGFYLVSQKQAHAWVEYLDETDQWVRFDPVSFIAPHRIQYGADTFYSFLRSGETDINKLRNRNSSIFKNWSKVIQSYYYTIGTMFFNYDLEYQKTLVMKLRNLNLKKLFNVKFLFVLIFIPIYFLFRVNFVDFSMYMALRRYNEITWNDFKYLDNRSMRKALPMDQIISDAFVKDYEKICYSGQTNVVNKLSFIWHAFKILTYEKSN